MNHLRPRHQVRCVLSAVAFIGTFGLTACAVGPDWKPQAEPKAQAYTPTPVPDRTVAAPGPAGAAQTFSPMLTLPADWWTLFHSPSLDALVRQGLERNPSVRAARSTLSSYQASLDAQTASLFFPAVDAHLSATRQRVSGAETGFANAPPTTYNLFNASVGVSYRPDVFGGSRRSVEASRAIVDYGRYELEAASLSLTSNLVTTAIAEASYRGQLDAVRDIVKSQKETLAVVERQFAAGAASKADVLAQRTQVAASEGQLPPLEKALAQTRHHLAVLAGDAPNRADLPEFTLADFQLPTEVPLSLPSELVHNRPDIAASEAALHEAGALVGVATANLYPQITLTGTAGYAGSTLSELFRSPNGIWSLGGALTQPLFHAGELRARRRYAEDQYDVARDNYEGTVLEAFRQVADTLRAIEWDAKALAAAASADELAKESLDLTRRQYAAGGVSYLTLLNAQRQYAETLKNHVQAQALRYADTAALYVALGGGWWNRSPAAAPVAAN